MSLRPLISPARASRQRAFRNGWRDIGLVVSGALLVLIAMQGVGPITAQADTRATTFEVAGSDDCYGDSVYRLGLPPRAIDISAMPAKGTSFYDPATAEKQAHVSGINGLRDGSQEVKWRITSKRCETFGPWSAGMHDFVVSYKVMSRRPRLSVRSAERATRLLLKERFGNAYYHGYGKHLTCRRKQSKNTRKCKFSWVIGDGYYYGRTTVSLFSKPNTDLFARVAFRAKLLDEYCVYALDKSRSACTKTYRGKRRID